MDFSILFESWELYLDGFITTVWMVAVALVVGLIIAIPVGIARNSKNPIIYFPAWAYIYFFRGTPLLIQLYLVYYGLSQLIEVQGTLWHKTMLLATLYLALQ